MVFGDLLAAAARILCTDSQSAIAAAAATAVPFSGAFDRYT